MTWYSFGGTQHGISPNEILTMPAWLRHDFLYIQRIIGDERDKARRNKKEKPRRKR